MMMLVGFCLLVQLREQLLLLRGTCPNMMLVGFCIPVRLRGGQLLLLSGTCPSDDASRFLPTRAVGRK